MAIKNIVGVDINGVKVSRNNTNVFKEANLTLVDFAPAVQNWSSGTYILNKGDTVDITGKHSFLYIRNRNSTNNLNADGSCGNSGYVKTLNQSFQTNNTFLLSCGTSTAGSTATDISLNLNMYNHHILNDATILVQTDLKLNCNFDRIASQTVGWLGCTSTNLVPDCGCGCPEDVLIPPGPPPVPPAPPVPPVVFTLTTKNPIQINSNLVQLSAYYYDPNYLTTNITGKGFVFGIYPNPTVESYFTDTITIEDQVLQEGNFYSEVTGFYVEGVTYYVRSYVIIDDIDIVYSGQISFIGGHADTVIGSTCEVRSIDGVFKKLCIGVLKYDSTLDKYCIIHKSNDTTNAYNCDNEYIVYYKSLDEKVLLIFDNTHGKWVFAKLNIKISDLDLLNQSFEIVELIEWSIESSPYTENSLLLLPKLKQDFIVTGQTGGTILISGQYDEQFSICNVSINDLYILQYDRFDGTITSNLDNQQVSLFLGI